MTGGPTARDEPLARAKPVSWLARLATIDQLADPTKCLWVSGLTLPFMVGWVVRLTHIRDNPDSARYVSRAFLPIMLSYQWVQLLGHVGLLLGALYLRRRGQTRARGLVHAEIQWWFASFAFSFYALGPFTSPFGMLLLVLPVGGSLMFPQRPMLYGFLALGIYCTLFIGLERLGVIPYAPFLATPPFEHGRPVNSWVMSIGAPATFATVLVLTAHSWIVAQWRRREHELRVLIGTDPLTGVANRRVFFERLDAEVSRSSRHGNPLSVLMVDVDHFKSINDRYGHQRGDLVLAAIAQGIRDMLRSADLVARFGGEEFAIILPETALVDATLVAERVRTFVGEQALGDPAQPIHTSVSIGVATLGFGELRDELIFRADEALLRAKRTGRDQVMVAPAAHASAHASEHAVA